MTVQLAGFTTVKRTGIALALGQTLTVDITLKLAAVETTVEVIGGGALDRNFPLRSQQPIDNQPGVESAAQRAEIFRSGLS